MSSIDEGEAVRDADDRARRQAGEALRSAANRARKQAQNRLAQLDELDRALEIDGHGQRDKAIRRLLARFANEMPIEDLAGRRSEVEAALDNDRLGSDLGDVAQDVIDRLCIVEESWPRSWPQSSLVAKARGEDDRQSSDLEERIKRSRKALEQIVIDAEMLTLPKRLREHLASITVGRSLVFDDLIEDETVNKRQRDQLFAWIAPYGRSLGALVDQEAGLIYKLSPERRWRIISYLSPLLLALLGGLILAGVSALDNQAIGINGITEVHLGNTNQLLAAYVLVLAGAVVHLIVENLKQAQTDAVPILAIDNFLAWLNLHWTGLLSTLGLILVVVIGLRVTNVNPGEHFAGYLAAGYSFDSLAGLFLTRFDVFAGKQVRGLRRQIKWPKGDKAEDRDENGVKKKKHRRRAER